MLSADESTAVAVPGRSGRIIYPAVSRRAGGLSLGVNLFPEGKRCNFDCAYCEVTAEKGGSAFTSEGLWAELEEWIGSHRAESGSARFGAGVLPVDIAFAGDGEPTLSSHLAEAIDIVAEARRRWPATLGGTKIVLITNSTGFLDPQVSGVLHRAAEDHGLEIWAKLDAGSEDWYRRVNRKGPPFGLLVDGLLEFARLRPVVLQTMFCALAEAPRGRPTVPSEREIDAWIDLVFSLASRGARFSEIHLYTQSRPAPIGLTAPLDDRELREIGRRFVAHGAGAATMKLRLFGASREINMGGGVF